MRASDSDIKHRKKPSLLAAPSPSKRARRRSADMAVEEREDKPVLAPSLWLSDNASKRAGETFFLQWTVVWIGLVALVVATQIFEHFTSSSYMQFGMLIAFPCMFYPLFFPAPADVNTPWHLRYTTKANVYVWILSFNANYFWTHYFYQVLGCKYTFVAWRLNDVPFCLFLMTQSYFATYHAVSNRLLRRLWNSLGNVSSTVNYAVVIVFLFILSYIVAFSETFTIQNFPYYELADRWAMYVYGSIFYAIYFMVSFPMFLRLDEKAGECWSMQRTVIDAMAASMFITTGLDFWRISIGPIVSHESKSSVPFVY